MFYPATATRIRQTVDACFGAAVPFDSGAPPVALVSPHAGIDYSGPIAASAWGTARSLAGALRRVVLAGPSHYVPFRGVALSTARAFRTPLGDVPVDLEGVREVVSLPCASFIDEAHAPEHSIEVQLPFLQVAIGAVPIVPLLLGTATATEVADAMASAGGFEPGTLVVVSSDLSHYLPYEEARVRDAETCERLLALDARGLSGDRACGHVPLSGLLLTARDRDLRPLLLDLRNSGDTGGGRARVVGYGAFAFLVPGLSPGEPKGD